MTKFGSVIEKPNPYFLKITFWKGAILPNGSSVILLYELRLEVSSVNGHVTDPVPHRLVTWP
jgi:hypothetical protein